jgi:hypothetical protein
LVVITNEIVVDCTVAKCILAAVSKRRKLKEWFELRFTVRQTGFLIRIALRKMVGEKMSKSTKALSTSK